MVNRLSKIGLPFCVALVLCSPSFGAKDCIQIINDSLTVNRTPMNGSPALGSAHKNQIFLMEGQMYSMYRITFRGSNGWVSKKGVKFVECTPALAPAVTPDTVTFDNGLQRFMHEHPNLTALYVFLIIAVVIVLILLTGDIFRKRHLGKSKRYLILVGSPEYKIKAEAGGLDLGTFLEKRHFTYSHVRNPEIVRKLLRTYTPDVIMADCSYDDALFNFLEQILNESLTATSIMLIAYNIAPHRMARMRSSLPHHCFFTSNMNARELDKVLQKYLANRGNHDTMRIRRVVESVALEGEIVENSISDVFQMIDMLQKTGTIHINRDNRPYGVIGFDSGMITFASTGIHEGREAIYEVLDMSSGSFRFVTDRFDNRNCTIPVIEVLMTWAQKKDESKVGISIKELEQTDDQTQEFHDMRSFLDKE